MNKAIAPILTLLIIGAFLLVVTLFAQSERQLTEARQMLAAERQRTQEAMDAAAQREAAFSRMESAMKDWERAAHRFEGTTKGALGAMENWRAVAKGWQNVAAGRLEACGITPLSQRSPFTACQPGQGCRTVEGGK